MLHTNDHIIKHKVGLPLGFPDVLFLDAIVVYFLFLTIATLPAHYELLIP